MYRLRKNKRRTPSLRRYTNLAAAIHLLKNQKISLLNPATWDDKNDAYFMAEYKRLKNANTVLALCFSQKETYHHWRVYSHGTDGVCIKFDKTRLLSIFTDNQDIKTGEVNYRTVKKLQSRKQIPVEELPFLKRYSFEDEREFRIIYENMKNASEYKEFRIDLDWIIEIVLSPWMSKELAKSVISTLRSIKKCSELKIRKSTLVDNETWKAITARVVTRKPSRKKLKRHKLTPSRRKGDGSTSTTVSI